MKKIVVLLTLFSFATICSAQSLLDNETIDMRVLDAPVLIENKSRVENIKVYPAELPRFDESVTTLNEGQELVLSSNISSVVGTFPYLVEGSTLRQMLNLIEDEEKDILEDWIYENIINRTEVWVELEFLVDGEMIVQSTVLKVERERGRDRSAHFKATIEDSHLGLRTVQVKVENPMGIPFILQNKALDFLVVVDGEGKAEVLNSKSIPDGVHSFSLMMELPAIGMASGGYHNLRVKDNTIFFGGYSPFDFGDEISFSDKRSTVRLKNLRNDPMTVLIPKYLVDGGPRPNFQSDDPPPGAIWQAVNIPAGRTARVNLPRGTTIRMVVQSAGKTAVGTLRLYNENVQRQTIGW